MNVSAGATPTNSAGSNTQRGVRGRYAKFNGSMDVLLLEALREHNPFTAKHGTRLQMWQSIAEIVGAELFKNPDAYSWHTCRCVSLRLLLCVWMCARIDDCDAYVATA